MSDPVTAAMILGGASSFNSFSSGLMNAVMAGHGQYRAYKYNRKLQQHQYELQQQGLREGPTNARQGFVDAGYNPILALQTGGQFSGAGNAGGVGAISGSMPDLGEAGTNAYRAFRLETQNMKNQTAQTEANVGLANAQAENAIQQAITEETKRRNLEFDSMMKDAQAHSINTKLPYEVRKLNEEIYNTMQDSELKRAISSIQAYDAETRRITANATATNAKASSDQVALNEETTVQEQAYRDKHPIYNFVDRWSKAISPWATPVVLGSSMNRGSTSSTSYNVNPVTGEVKNVKKTHTQRRRR